MAMMRPPLGDEVIEWNGQVMCNRSGQEVHDIIADSKNDMQVELIVSRVIADSRRTAQMSWRQLHLESRYRQTGIPTIINNANIETIV